MVMNLMPKDVKKNYLLSHFTETLRFVCMNVYMVVGFRI